MTRLCFEVLTAPYQYEGAFQYIFVIKMLFNENGAGYYAFSRISQLEFYTFNEEFTQPPYLKASTVVVDLYCNALET